MSASINTANVTSTSFTLAALSAASSALDAAEVVMLETEAVTTNSVTENTHFRHMSKVRRPYRGIEIKPESFASLSVVTHTHKEEANVSLYNSSSEEPVAFTSNFLINSVSENRQEKHQPVLTFGKDYVYFFGEHPRQLSVNATLLNTENFRWEAEWWANYDEFFRGTKLAASEQEACLRVDESIVYGFLISASTSKDSNNPSSVALTFVLHVTHVVSTKQSSIGSHLISNSDGYFSGNVDLNLADLTSLEARPSTIKGVNGIQAYNLARQDDIGALTKFLGSVKEKVSSTAKDLIDFYYGRTIVLPADAAFADFASGSEQRIEVRDTTFYDNSKNFTGKYTDNFDEYPFFAKKFDKIDLGESIDPMDKMSKEAAKLLSASFNATEEELLAVDSATGIPKFSKFTRLLGKATFAAVNIGLANKPPINREKLASGFSNFTTESDTAASIVGAAAGPLVG